MRTACIFAFALVTSAAMAQTLFTFPSGKGGNPISPGFPVVEACRFTVGANSVTINQLGHEVGWLSSGPRPVAVWDWLSGALMGQVSIDGTEPEDNGYCYRAVTPITLQANRSYVLGALHGSGPGQTYLHNTNVATFPAGITDNGSWYWITNTVGPNPNWSNGGGPRYFVGNAKFGPAPHNLNYTVILSDFVPSPTNAVPITLTVIQGGNVVHTKVVNLGSAGVFATMVPSNVTGVTRFCFDGATFLRKCLTVTLPPLGSNGGTLILTNGDADGSGEVDAADIDLVIAHVGHVPTSPGWLQRADLDRSDEVDVADIDIAIASFGSVDDPI